MIRSRLFTLIALSTLMTVGVGCTRINPGHVGIKVVAGGSDKGVSDFPSQVGWVFYNPFTTRMLEYPTFVQTAVWTQNPGEGHPLNEEITFTNKDKMTISVDVNLSYHIDQSKVPHFYVKFRSDDISTFTYGYLHNTARDTFNEHAGKYSIDQIMGDNAAFLKDVRDGLQAEVAPIGVVIDQFGIIGAPRPPAFVLEQINSSAHASQLATQKQNELAQVQADLAKQTATTRVNADNLIIAAEAEAKSNRLISESINGNLLQKMRLERWDGKLPYINGGSTNPFVSIDGNTK